METLRTEDDDRRLWESFSLDSVTDILRDLVEYFAQPGEESGKSGTAIELNPLAQPRLVQPTILTYIHKYLGQFLHFDWLIHSLTAPVTRNVVHKE